MITKNVRTHYILIKQWEKNDILKIPITNAQYNLYKEELSIKKYNEMITINDIDTEEIVFEWRANKIEWFTEIKKDETLSQKRVVCEYWKRHNIQWYPKNCTCKEEIWCIGFMYHDRLKEMWYKISYPSDITEEMRIAYINKFNK